MPISLQPALGIAAEQIWDEGVAAVAAVRLADLTNMGDEDAEQDIIVGDRAVESVLTLAARDRIDAVEFDEVGLPFEECLRPEGKCLLAQYDNNWAADSDVFELLAQDALRRRRS